MFFTCQTLNTGYNVSGDSFTVLKSYVTAWMLSSVSVIASSIATLLTKPLVVFPLAFSLA